MKFRKDTHLSDWISANPEVDKWFKRAEVKNADSAKVTASYIYTYWNEHLWKRLPDIQARVVRDESPGQACAPMTVIPALESDTCALCF